MIEVSGEFKVTHAGSVDDLSAHLDDVMDCLVDLDRVLDAAIEADLGASVIVITVTFAGDDLEQDAPKAIAAIRTAIHAAGGNTPGWDEAFQLVRNAAELVNA